jgi:hypothetical protein
MITTRLIKYIVDVVGNIAENTININYKAIVEVLMEVYFKIIIKRNVIFIRS